MIENFDHKSEVESLEKKLENKEKDIVHLQKRLNEEALITNAIENENKENKIKIEELLVSLNSKSENFYSIIKKYNDLEKMFHAITSELQIVKNELQEERKKLINSEENAKNLKESLENEINFKLDAEIKLHRIATDKTNLLTENERLISNFFDYIEEHYDKMTGTFLSNQALKDDPYNQVIFNIQ